MEYSILIEGKCFDCHICNDKIILSIEQSRRYLNEFKIFFLDDKLKFLKEINGKICYIEDKISTIYEEKNCEIFTIDNEDYSIKNSNVLNLNLLKNIIDEQFFYEDFFFLQVKNNFIYVNINNSCEIYSKSNLSVIKKLENLKLSLIIKDRLICFKNIRSEIYDKYDFCLNILDLSGELIVELIISGKFKFQNNKFRIYYEIQNENFFILNNLTMIKINLKEYLDLI